MDGPPPVEEDFSKVSTEDLVVHKNWKARQLGYEKAKKEFELLDEKHAQFQKYLGLVKRFAVETNVIALEKGLEALFVYVENAAVAGKTAGETCPTLVQKCIANTKQKIREKSQEILLMYIEIERQDIVLDALLEGFQAKNPKVVKESISTITSAVNQFGVKPFGSVKNVAKQIAPLMEHANADVREQTKQMTIALYRWIGDAFRPQIQNLKPIQLSELESEFKQVETASTPSRYLRSQKPAPRQAGGVVSNGAEAEEIDGVAPGPSAAPPAPVDPWEFLDPLDVLAKLPKDFYEQLESKKWLERKKPLDDLCNMMTQNPRLDTKAQYGEIVAVLKKIVSKDSNINVAASAGKCLAGLARGLRKKFASFAVMVAPVVLEKFKDKKPVVLNSMVEAIDEIAKTTTLDALSEEIVACFEKPSPHIKIQTALFLHRTFRFHNQQTLSKKLMKILAPPVVKLINDSDPEVREAAAAALGSAMNAVGEKGVLPFLSDIIEDKLKMAKIQEFHHKARQEAGNEVVCSMVQSMHKTNQNSGQSSPPKTDVSKPKPGGSKAPVRKVLGGKKGANDGGKKTTAKSGDSAAIPVVPEEPEISMEEAVEKANELFTEATVTALESANWKERLEALDQIGVSVKSMDPSSVPTQVVLKVLNKKKEANFQIVNQKFELYAYVANNCNMTGLCFSLIVGELLEKIGDSKHTGGAKLALTNCAEALGLYYVSDKVSELAMSMKSPKSQSESLTWIGNSINEFGSDVNVKSLVEVIQKSIFATNPAVRSAGVELSGILFLHVGPRIRAMLQNEKGPIAQTLQNEFQKHEGNDPPAPTKRSKLGPVSSQSSSQEQNDNGKSRKGPSKSGKAGDSTAKIAEEPEISTDEAVERGSEMFTEATVAAFESANWKERLEALEKVAGTVKSMDPISVSTQVVLKVVNRKKEANFQIINQKFELYAFLAKYCPLTGLCFSLILAELMEKIGDSKHMSQAKEALSVCAETLGLYYVSEKVSEMTMGMKSPKSQSESLTWIGNAINEFGADVNVKSLVEVIQKSIAATNPAVRSAGVELAGILFLHVGPRIRAMLQNEKGPIAQTLQNEFQKHDGDDAPAPTRKSKVPQKAAPPSRERESAPRESSSARTSPKRDPSVAKSVQNGSSKDRARSSSRKPGETSRPKKGDESFDGGALIDNGLKTQRFNDERALRALKWNFSTPTEDHVEQLKQQMATVAKPALHSQLFHSDFKQHLKALENMTAALDLCTDAVIGASDLLLKWCTFRFFDTNPSVLLKCLDFIKAMLNLFEEKELELSDYEVNAFVPYLLLKAGEAKDIVRKQVKHILQQICRLTAASKVFPLIMEGTKTKNSRQKAECLEQMGYLIEGEGMPVCGQPQPVIKAIAQNIGDRDNTVRNAALNTLIFAYMYIGERLYKYCGSAIGDKELAMLEERIRRSAKNPPKITKPQPTPKAVRGSTPAKKPPSRSPSADERHREQPKLKRPASAGMFQLELTKVCTDSDGDEKEPDEPELIDHSEVYQIMKKPIVMPQIRTRHVSPTKRTSSISSVGSMDASVALDNVISQVTSSAIPTAVQAVVQLDELLKDPSKLTLLTGKIDQMLMALYFQLRMIYSTHLSDDSLDAEEVTQLYRSLCAMLLALLQCEGLAREATDGPLKDLACQLLTVLLDSRLEQLPDGTQVVRSINVITVKLVEKTDPSACMICFMRLLRETLHSQTASTKFQELVLKCLWKHCRKLPTIASEVNVGRILAEAHQFFVEFPVESWKQRSGDTPVRTIKTILNNLAKSLGDKVLDYVGLIDQPQNSEAVQYLRKSLRELGKQGNLPGQPMQNGHSAVLTESGNKSKEPSPAVQSPQQQNQQNANVSVSHANILAETFKRIADKENTKEGLLQLYEFKQSNPDVDIEPYLRRSTEFFRTYVHRSLQQIEDERKRTSGQNGNDVTNGTVTTAEPSAYLSRLQELRNKIGFAPATVAVKRPTDEEISLPQLHPSATSPNLNRTFDKDDEDKSPMKKPTSMGSASDLGALKKRLEMIKRGSQL